MSVDYTGMGFVVFPFACIVNRGPIAGLLSRAIFLDLGGPMGLTSRDRKFIQKVPKGGIEPPLCCQNWILNPARLPVPPLRHQIHILAIKNGRQIYLKIEQSTTFWKFLWWKKCTCYRVGCSLVHYILKFQHRYRMWMDVLSDMWAGAVFSTQKRL